MLDSDIEACVHLLNCKPVDTQPMGICFHKITNIMRTRKGDSTQKSSSPPKQMNVLLCIIHSIKWHLVKKFRVRNYNLSLWQQHCVRMTLPGSHWLWLWMFTKDYGGLCGIFRNVCVRHKMSNKKLIRLILTFSAFCVHLSTHA